MTKKLRLTPTLLITLFIVIISNTAFAQLDLQCAGRDMHSVYLIGSNSSTIYRVDSVDTNPTGLIPVQPVPGTTVGISINNNLDSAAGPVTMYYVNAATNQYYFWNGTGWSNTGHTCGFGGAVNPGGTSSYIFNFGAGGVYRYNGTANGTLLTTIGGNILADVATDSVGNFYLFFTATKEIIAYTFAGIPIDTFAVTGSMGTSGGGFALLGNRFYTESITALHEGIITGDTVNFTVIVAHPNITSNDLAVCPANSFPVAVFKNPELPHFIIYPNPVHDVATIKLHNTITLEVYNYMGVLQQTIPVKGLAEYRLDVSKLKDGIYFINAVSATKTTSGSRLVVQH